MVKAINFRLMTLYYAGLMGPAATDETAWTGVMLYQSQMSVELLSGTNERDVVVVVVGRTRPFTFRTVCILI